MAKYTVVWVDSWMSGSHRQSVTKIHYIETEDGQSPWQHIESAGVIDTGQVVAIFEGQLVEVSGHKFYPM